MNRHMKVHVKYSNESPQSTQDICRDLPRKIVNEVVTSTEESSGMKRKYEEVTGEAQATIDKEALEQSALKIQREYEDKIALGKALYKIINKGVVQEESCPPQWQNALYLYLKQGH
jgi:hypothetical protein